MNSHIPAPSPSPGHRLPLAEALTRLDCCAGLELGIRQAMAGGAQSFHYKEGDTIIGAGYFDGQQMYGLLSGRARLVRPASRDGDFNVIEIQAGDVIGLAETLAFTEPRSGQLSVTALTDTEVVTIDGTTFRGLLNSFPEMTQAFLRYSAQQWLALAQAPVNAEKQDRRVYQHLLSLVRREGDQFVISEMPRHSVLAERCGVTDRDAAAAVAALIDGAIARREYPGLIIEDMAALRSVCL